MPFYYNNAFAEGGFRLSQVSDWVKDPNIGDCYIIHLMNSRDHTLDETDFARFREAWEGVAPLLPACS